MALDFENQFYSDSISYIVGTDEAGRGCLLGPVFAAAVILPPNFTCPLINDSKKLSEKKREEAYKIIIDNALDFSIVSIDPIEIDKINILEASRKAMTLAINNLKHPYDLIISDYMKLPSFKCQVIDLAHGDAKAQCVAAASILAKVSRDTWCYENADKYPEFNIKKNKGYGTKDHLESLKKYGPIKGLHRFSYGPIKDCLIEKISLF